MKLFEKQEFPELTRIYKLALLPVAVALSFVIPLIVRDTLRIPLFLDTTGTVLVAMIAGPWWAVAEGLLLVTVRAILRGPLQFTGILTFGVGGIFFGYAVKYGWTKTWPRIAVLMVAFAFILSICSATTATFVYGGFTGDPWDIFIAAGTKLIGSIWFSLLAIQFVISIIDKSVVTVLVIAILSRLPPRFRKLSPITSKSTPSETKSTT